MKAVLRAALVVLAAIAMLAGVRIAAQTRTERPAAAQTPATGAQSPKRSWYAVNVITVKREKAEDWVDFTKSETIPMQQRGGLKMRQTWASGQPFGQGSTAVVVTPIENFADFDKPPLVARVLSGDALRAYQQKNASLVERNVYYALQDRTELSIPPSSTAKVAGGMLTDITVIPGHDLAYEAYLKNDLLPVMKKANVPAFIVSKTVFGGDANEYHLFQYFETYSDFDKGPVTWRVLGETAGRALAAKAQPHIASTKRTILRYVPELSFDRRTTS